MLDTELAAARRNEPIPALESRRPVIGTVQRVPASVLSLSEPNPGSHKNPPNSSTNPHWTALNWLTIRHHFVSEHVGWIARES